MELWLLASRKFVALSTCLSQHLSSSNSRGRPMLNRRLPAVVYRADWGSKPGRLIVVETYPAECYGWFIQGGLKGKKGDAGVRKKAGGALIDWAGKANVKLDLDLTHAIEQGFPDGDDAFDATVGLFGMLEVLLGRRTAGDPN